jgi:hypothetical protein
MTVKFSKILFLILMFSTVDAWSLDPGCKRHCLPPGHYYYGYSFDSFDFDYEVDNACVDFCLDKKHSLQHCTRVCSNYTRPIDYPDCI